MDPAGLAVRIAADVGAVVGWSALVGATAPRWPDRWLTRDTGPLRLTRRETPAAYRRAGVPRLTQLLPEGGDWLGGRSKDRLPGTDVASLQAYLVEVRRAEWVHLLSLLAVVPPMAVAATAGPAWLGVAFAVVVVGVNAPFLLVLRYNRVRLGRVLARAGARIAPVPATG